MQFLYFLNLCKNSSFFYWKHQLLSKHFSNHSITNTTFLSNLLSLILPSVGILIFLTWDYLFKINCLILNLLQIPPLPPPRTKPLVELPLYNNLPTGIFENSSDSELEKMEAKLFNSTRSKISYKKSRNPMCTLDRLSVRTEVIIFYIQFFY